MVKTRREAADGGCLDTADGGSMEAADRGRMEAADGGHVDTPDEDTGNTVFVRNVPHHMRSSQLKTLFQPYGKITHVHIISRQNPHFLVRLKKL